MASIRANSPDSLRPSHFSFLVCWGLRLWKFSLCATNYFIVILSHSWQSLSQCHCRDQKENKTNRCSERDRWRDTVGGWKWTCLALSECLVCRIKLRLSSRNKSNCHFKRLSLGPRALILSQGVRASGLCLPMATAHMSSAFTRCLCSSQTASWWTVDKAWCTLQSAGVSHAGECGQAWWGMNNLG